MVERAGWSELARELDQWADAGIRADFWWRDDDAEACDSRLETLLELRAAFSLPLALAIPPATARPDLWSRLAASQGAIALVHGAAHRNHAPPGEKKAEFGPHRPKAAMGRELADALLQLTSAAGAAGVTALPVLVPPWNRIDMRLISALPGLGYRGLSAFGSRQTARPLAGLAVCNCHLDIIDWRGARGLVPPGRLLATLTGQLAARRALLLAGPRRADRAPAAGEREPIGILTHHRVQERDSNDFLRLLFDRLCQSRNGQPVVRWLSAREIFVSDADATGELSTPPRNG